MAGSTDRTNHTNKGENRQRGKSPTGKIANGGRKTGRSTYLGFWAFLGVEETTRGRAVWRLSSASEYRQMGSPGQDCGGAI